MKAPRHGHGKRLAVGFGLCGALALSPFLAPDAAHAAGFDCSLAKTHVEKLICTVPELSSLDDQMKVLYDKIESETAGHDGDTGLPGDPAGKEQSHWRMTVRDKCQDAACLESVYVARLAAMRKNWADALSPEDQ
jgi:uncharacterized protein